MCYISFAVPGLFLSQSPMSLVMNPGLVFSGVGKLRFRPLSPVQAVILPAHPNTKQKSPDPTTIEGSEVGGSSFQVVVPGSTGQRAGPRHLSKLRAPV